MGGPSAVLVSVIDYHAIVPGLDSLRANHAALKDVGLGISPLSVLTIRECLQWVASLDKLFASLLCGGMLCNGLQGPPPPSGSTKAAPPCEITYHNWRNSLCLVLTHFVAEGRRCPDRATRVWLAFAIAVPKDQGILNVRGGSKGMGTSSLFRKLKCKRVKYNFVKGKFVFAIETQSFQSSVRGKVVRLYTSISPGPPRWPPLLVQTMTIKPPLPLRYRSVGVQSKKGMLIIWPVSPQRLLVEYPRPTQGSAIGDSDGVLVSVCDYHAEGPGFDSPRDAPPPPSDQSIVAADKPQEGHEMPRPTTSTSTTTTTTEEPTITPPKPPHPPKPTPTSSTTTPAPSTTTPAPSTTTPAPTTPTPAPTTPTPAPTTPTPAPTSPTPAPSTPTPAPAPTPSPAPHNDIPWVVKDGNQTCILANMDIHFNVPYNTTANKTAVAQVVVPKNATASGHCNAALQVLHLTWGANYVQFTFASNKTTKRYWVSSVMANLTADPAHFPNSTDDVVVRMSDHCAKGPGFDSPRDQSRLKARLTSGPSVCSLTACVDYQTKLFVLTHTDKAFSTSMNKSYSCPVTQELKMTLQPTNTTGPLLAFNSMHFDAFHTGEKTEFAAAEQCETGQSPDIVPIVVGCVLAALVVLVLVGYLIGRRRSQARGYLSM
ncbi:hypothetical protein AAG570_001599 [Ranatra chinensis]|uniref:Lysosome-associated membrane glycoprotein 5 n=1 Tax=Ranatra chinensis TaxID=642074 RepID=A0ABD0Y8Z9_9HEMI